MRKLFSLVKSHMRGGIGQSLAFLILMILSAFLLDLGLNLSLNYSNFINTKAEELNSEHVQFTILDIDKDTFEDIVEDHSQTKDYEISRMMTGVGKFNFWDKPITSIVKFYNLDDERKISKTKVIDELSQEEKDKLTEKPGVMVSYIFKTNGGYELGDEIRIDINGENYDFYVYAFNEDIFAGSGNNMLFGLKEENFNDLINEMDEEHKSQTFKIQLKDSSKQDSYINEVSNEFISKIEQEAKEAGLSEDSVNAAQRIITTFQYNMVKARKEMTSYLLASLIIAFLLIVMLISIIIIRFRISSYISERITEIGALKAIGYTSGQIIFSLIVQFVLIGLLAAMLGIILSQLSLPNVSFLLAQDTGLIWNPEFDI